jgi:uncharacterized protein YceK
MQKFVLLVLIIILAQGCTTIAQPTATLDLVAEKYVATADTHADSSLSAALTASKTGTILVHEDQNVEIGRVFFAATGEKCRKVSFQQAGLNLYCRSEQGYWFKVNNVISQYNENDSGDEG